MKLNGKENYIMLVSMGRHNIIFPWFFFCRQPPWSCVAPTVCVCAISTCTGLLRVCVRVRACLCVCVSASSSSSGLRVSKLLLSVDFLFIYFMPTHIRAKQFDRCRRLSGCLADQLTASVPVPAPASASACLPPLVARGAGGGTRVWLLCDSKGSVPGQREGRGG